MEVIQFADGPTRCEVWELPDTGWDDWSAVVDRFLVHAITNIATEYVGESVEWLEVNHWVLSGRLLVFPSQDGPLGDRQERVCFELSSGHLEAAAERVSAKLPEAEQDGAWVDLSRRVWVRISTCLTAGDAGHELAAARQLHRMRLAGYDYEPGEGLWWLTEDGSVRG